VSLFKKPEAGEEEKVGVPVRFVMPETSPERDLSVVPDSATPVYGFRLWTIERVMAKLIGTYAPWTVGRNEAKCDSSSTFATQGFAVSVTTTLSRTPSAHAAPDPSCRCGFNALDKWEALEIKAGHYGEPQVVAQGSGYTQTYPSWVNGNVEDILYPQVPGVAKGWGRVMIHSGGWRSQFAEIVALIDLCAVLPWFERDEKYHKLLEYSAKHYGVPIIEHIPDLGEFA